MEDRVQKIESQLDAMKHLLIKLNKNIEKIDIKIDKLQETMEGELIHECKKMGSHIDFVETVYENVKHPLGYICKKVGYITGNSNEIYSLTDISTNKIIDKENDTISSPSSSDDSYENPWRPERFAS